MWCKSMDRNRRRSKIKIVNPIAKILRTPLFRKRVVRSRVKYTRKDKHKKRGVSNGNTSSGDT